MVNVRLVDSPGLMTTEKDPSSAVTVCGSGSRLVHVTVSPRSTATLSGWNAECTASTVMVAAAAALATSGTGATASSPMTRDAVRGRTDRRR